MHCLVSHIHNHIHIHISRLPFHASLISHLYISTHFGSTLHLHTRFRLLFVAYCPATLLHITICVLSLHHVYFMQGLNKVGAMKELLN